MELRPHSPGRSSDSPQEEDVIVLNDETPSNPQNQNKNKNAPRKSKSSKWKKKASHICKMIRTKAGQMFGAEEKSSSDDDEKPLQQDSSDDEAENQFVQVDVLRHDLNRKRNFPNNSIHTAKYTLYNAIPLSILFQFHKVSNIYFLLVMVFTLIPGASPINPFSSVVPLCIVLGVGVLKDLVEDFKRSKSDRLANAMPAQVLVKVSEKDEEEENNKKKKKKKKNTEAVMPSENMRQVRFSAVASKDLRPGDVVLLRLGEEVKADCVLLNTSLPDGLTYIETANLDGETNAKTRRAHYNCVEKLSTVEDIVEYSLSAYFSQKGTNDWPRRGFTDGKKTCGCCGGDNSDDDDEDVMQDEEVINMNHTTVQEARSDVNSQLPLEMSRNAFPSSVYQNTGNTNRTNNNNNNTNSGLSPGEESARVFETYDERLERDGVLLPPRDVLELSRRYEEQQQRTPRSAGLPFTITRILGMEEDNDLTGGYGRAAVDPSQFKKGVVLLGNKPCPDLYSWFGQMRLPDSTHPSGTTVIPLGIDQFIPRGCIIRNTNWVLAAVLYTGKDTKMLLNLRPKKYKTTVMTQRLNQVNLILFILTQVIMLILCGLALWFKKKLNNVPGNADGEGTWYVQWNNNRYSDPQLFFWRYLTNFVILSYLIPVSLYVTLEINKAVQMALIALDKRMSVFDEFSGKLRYARPKTSDLNCQLAQVQYVFTDKTGTLTENLMTYVGGRAGNVSHDERALPGGLGLALLAQIVNLRGGGKNQPLSPGSRHSGDAAAGSNYLSPGLSRRPAGSIPDLLLLSQTQGSATGEGEEGQSRQEAKVFTAAEESILEDNHIFKYLRSLSLCHSVVCFDAVEPVAAPKKEKKKNKKKKKDKKNGEKDETKQQKEKEKKRKRTEKRNARKQAEIEKEKERDAKERRKLLAELDKLNGTPGVTHPRRLFYVPNAVPSGPADAPQEDGQASDGERTNTRLNSSLHRRESTANLDAMAPLPSPSMHGRTGSSAWYFNRFNANATQTHESSIRQQHLSSGSMYYNTINNPTASTTRQMAKLEPYFHSLLDRSKVFEGQSLDEIALVSAARENGFTLFQRTAKYMFVKFLDKMMCYEIIAECEFTPQRKLMSILLKRNEALDSRQAAEAAMAGTNVDYHRDGSTEGSPSMNGKREEHSINKSDSYGSPSPPRDGLTQAASPKGSSVPLQNDIPPKEVSHSPFHTPTRADRENEKFGAHQHQRVLSLDSVNHSSNSHDSEWEDSPPLMHRAETEAFQKGENNGEESERSVSTKEGGNNNNNNGGKRKTSGGRESSMYSNVDAPTVDTKSIQVPQFLQRQKQEEEEKEKNSEKKKENPKPYLLLVKGADSSMLDIVDFHTIQQNVKQKDALLDELQKTASLGLRTLLLGERYLSEEEVRAWLPIYRDAQCCMNHRSERLHEAYALLERDINLIGSTAVEDKLQEGVPETLQFLSEASMVVWMLTGDKRETAVTIAKTCGLVDTNTENEALSASSSGHLPPVDPQATSQTSKKKNGLQNNNGIPSTICHIDLADLIAEEHAFVQSQQRKKQENEAAKKKVTSREEEEAETFAVQNGDEQQKNLEFYHNEKLRTLDEQLLQAEQVCCYYEQRSGTKTVVIVVDGKTLDFIFSNKKSGLVARFFELGCRCRSAVCCRMTPLQKAQIVRLFQKNSKHMQNNSNSVALAIGDGANDVSMIQEAKVGIGIMGLEGSQAELASDYAIPKFRFLKRLLFVHGRACLYRDAHCILFSLYKNTLITVGMITYTFYSGYSGMSFMDSWLLAMHSLFFCALQPLLIGIVDKDVDDELAETIPQLYPALSREVMYFSVPYILKFCSDALVEGFAFYFVVLYTCGNQEDLFTNGPTGCIEDYGFVFFTMITLIADLRVSVLVSYYMILFLLANVGELIILPVGELVYTEMHNLAGSNWSLYVGRELYGQGKFYLFLFVAVGIFVVYSLSTNLYIQLFRPWVNAPFAVHATNSSPYRRLYKINKLKLLSEYKERVAALRERTEAAAPS